MYVSVRFPWLLIVICCRFKESYKEPAIQSALPFAMNSEFADVLKETMVGPTVQR